MAKLIQVLTALLLAAGTWFLAEGAWLMHSERLTVESTLRDVHITILEAGLTLKNLREASEAWKQASQQQISSTTKVLSSVDAAVARFTSFVSSTDNSLNSNFLPTLSTTVREQNRALLESQKDLQENLAGIVSATQQLQKTLADADAQISNPAIKESLEHLTIATADAAEATKHLANITAAGERTAAYYEKRLTTPQSFFKTLAQFILQAGSQARILLNK
jgi:DNA-binding transcriptional MerR regulator